MLCLRSPLPFISSRLQVKNRSSAVVLCALKGPRPRSPRVWKTRQRIGTISKSAKLVECIRGLSNVKEEVYGALDSFVAWELEFPLIAVKKALKTLENEQEWKRIIQVIKWMLSKGQGRTMGTYFTLLNALAEDQRLDEAEELWNKIFSDHLEATPRIFFDKMISIYYKREKHDKMFEIFADMEELGVRPSVSTVSMVGNVFKKLGMLDKYQKLKKKYPPPKWEYRYIKGKRVRIRAKHINEFDGTNEGLNRNKESPHRSNELDEEDNAHLNKAVVAEVSNELEESDSKLSEANVEEASDEFEEASLSEIEIEEASEASLSEAEIVEASDESKETSMKLSEAHVEATHS